jgi:hypothetical protein
MSLRGEKPWPSAGTSNVRPRGKSVTVYGEFPMTAVTDPPDLHPELRRWVESQRAQLSGQTDT